MVLSIFGDCSLVDAVFGRLFTFVPVFLLDLAVDLLLDDLSVTRTEGERRRPSP